MGQQQLLLIVLGVILVGVAVVLGIQYFGVGSNEGAKDELVAHNLTIGANAQEWYKKPVAMGGGGGAWDVSQGATQTFAAYFLAKMVELQHSTNSKAAPAGYTVTVDNANQITIMGYPKDNQGFTFASVKTIVTPTSMTTTIQ